jgi:glucose-1-phosphate cytidylyltransferase
MKVVLFCGGLGLRLRDYSDQVPKPMVAIGYRPILWHVMKYFAHFGHRDFILCLGYRGDLIKKYFLDYSECASNDFVFSDGGRTINTFNNDIEDWRITFADTGLHSNIGERLLAIENYLEGEQVFLANYSDGLTDLDFNSYLKYALKQDKIANFMSVKPSLSYHTTRIDKDGLVTNIDELAHSGIRINAGYFVLKRDIFSYFRLGEDLVIEPFQRLIQEKQLSAYEYDGFFTAMDTFKDKQVLDNLHERGNPPWEVWRSSTRTETQSVRDGGLLNSKARLARSR